MKRTGRRNPPDTSTEGEVETMEGILRKGCIVVGVDGSSGGQVALEWAATRASTRRKPMLLVHAFSPDNPTFAFGMGSDARSVRADAERLLASARARVLAVDKTLEVATVSANGFASGALVRASYDAGMVVVGAHGHGPLSMTPVGSVALQVATHAQSPVAVIRHSERGREPYGRVIVGVDGSDESLAALDFGFAEAEARDAELLVLHAWQPKGSDDPTLSEHSDWPAYESAQRRMVHEAISAETERHPDVKVSQEVARAKSTKLLAQRAQSADAIVVGSRGLGGFDGLLLGSVSHGVLDHCSCPVVVMRRRHG